MILRNSFVSTLSQLTGRLANFILPLIFLAKFGGSSASDTLFLALSVVFFFGSTLSNSASDAFTPSLSDQYFCKPDVKWLILNILLSAVASILIVFFASGFSYYVLSISLVSFLLVFVGLSSSFQVSKLYYFGNFTTPGISWSLRWISLLPILFIQDVFFAALGFLIFILIADTGRLFLLIKSVVKLSGFRSIVEEKVLSSGPVIWFMCSSSLSGLNPLVDRFIASYIGEGSVSQLELIERIASLFLLIPTVGVLQVLNVEINKKIKNDSGWKYSNFLGQVFLSSIAWSLFCFFVLWLFRDHLFEIFEVGIWGGIHRFTYGLVILIAMAPALFTGMIGVRILLALNKGRLVLMLSGASLIVNAVTSIPLGVTLGVNGILLATIFTYSFTAVLLMVICSKYCSVVRKRL